MAATILRMSDSETIKFLNLYKNEPVLWNPSRGDYKNRECRSAATKRIAAEMNMPEFTDYHVMLKFKNLRSSYLQELKKMARNAKSENGKPYYPKVIWFKIMDSFLRSYVTSKNSELHPEETVVSNFDGNNSENSCLASLLVDNTQAFYQEYRKQPTESAKKEDSNLIQRNRFVQSPVKRKLIDRDVTVDEMGTINISPSTDACSSCASIQRNEDCFDLFGKYVASLLRILPQQRSYRLQADIVSMITSSSSFSSHSFQSTNCVEETERLSPVDLKPFEFSDNIVSEAEDDSLNE